MLSVPAALVVALEEHAPMIAPPWVFALIAIAFFLVLGLVTWSFRDVANRHSDRLPPASGHDQPSDHH